MALLKIGLRRSWPGNAALKRQLLKQLQQRKRRMALLKIGQRRSWPGNAATEEAAVETVPAEEEEDGPLGDWTKKELAEECSH